MALKTLDCPNCDHSWDSHDTYGCFAERPDGDDCTCIMQNDDGE